MATKSQFKVTKTTAGQRLDVFLAAKMHDTRSQVQKLIEIGQVTVNDKIPKTSGVQITIGDVIIVVPKEIQKNEEKKAEQKMADKQSEIKIVAETPDYIIVDKPTGMLTHSTTRDEQNSLAEILVRKYPGLTKVGDDPARPGIVHRLDKESSGLLAIPRTPDMFDHLKAQFKNHTIEKDYLVLVHEPVPINAGEINFPLIRSKDKNRMSALPITQGGEKNLEGKRAWTEFEEIQRFVNFSLLRVRIHTGRMHQIRAHFLAYNHPVVGDPLYFQKKQKRNWDNKLGRLFLHCTKISFTDLAGKIQTFESPLPKELGDFLKLLK